MKLSLEESLHRFIAACIETESKLHAHLEGIPPPSKQDLSELIGQAPTNYAYLLDLNSHSRLSLVLKTFPREAYPIRFKLDRIFKAVKHLAASTSAKAELSEIVIGKRIDALRLLEQELAALITRKKAVLEGLLHYWVSGNEIMCTRFDGSRITCQKLNGLARWTLSGWSYIKSSTICFLEIDYPRRVLIKSCLMQRDFAKLDLLEFASKTDMYYKLAYHEGTVYIIHSGKHSMQPFITAALGVRISLLTVDEATTPINQVIVAKSTTTSDKSLYAVFVQWKATQIFELNLGRMEGWRKFSVNCQAVHSASWFSCGDSSMLFYCSEGFVYRVDPCTDGERPDIVAKDIRSGVSYAFAARDVLIYYAQGSRDAMLKGLLL
mmetsp:Transcript_1634/g.3522  ORF Transcript_1634/g.3522 Transcript_1634/m.3522 type:complete len:379 (-) Transcript_1634:1001-2137(-)